MSLAGQVSALATRSAQAQKAQRSAPSWAPPVLANAYDASRAGYNVKQRNTRRIRRGIGRALAGTGRLDLLFVGDSQLIGTTGTNAVADALAYPRVAQLALAKELGVPVAGSGTSPIVMGNGIRSDKWTTVSGTLGTTVYPGCAYLTNNGQIRFDSGQPGTVVRIFYFDNSGSGFTYSIDGATPVSVTTGAVLTTLKMIEVAGLSYAPHSILLTAASTAATFLFLAGAGTYHSTGIAVHNLGWGGARVTGTPDTNWNDTTSAIKFQAVRKGMMALQTSLAIDAVGISVGSNDVFQGQLAPAIVTGLTTLGANWSASSDLFHVVGWEVPGSNAQNFADTLSARYTLADTLDCPLIDWRDVVGSQAIALAAGELLAVDSTHPSAETNYGFGVLLARNLAAGNGPKFNPSPLPPFTVPGSLGTYVGQGRFYNDTNRTLTVQGVRASVGTAPTGASIIVDVNKNGTTLFTTQANRPTIAAGATTSGVVAALDITTLASGDYLTIDIDQIGSTVAGADLSVQVMVA